jgi:hypothetical protein
MIARKESQDWTARKGEPVGQDNQDRMSEQY